jgi:Na+-driven multidrug efflux pump
VLVRVWGIRGVALATVLAYIIERIFLVSWLKIKMKISPGQYIHIRKHVIWSALIIITYLLVEVFIRGRY